MKQLIKNRRPEECMLGDLIGTEILVYLASQTNTPKILCRLYGSGEDWAEKPRWGFCSIAYPTGDTVFCSPSFFDSAEKALNSGRRLYAFDNYSEFRKWLGEQKIIHTGYRTRTVLSEVEKEKRLFGKTGANFEYASSAGFFVSPRRKIEPLTVGDIKWNGSDEVIPNPANATVLYRKINALVDAHNNLNNLVKEALLSKAYGGDGPPKSVIRNVTEPSPVLEPMPMQVPPMPETFSKAVPPISTGLHSMLEAKENYYNQLYRLPKKTLDAALDIAITSLKADSGMTDANFSLLQSLENLRLNQETINTIELI